MGLVKLNDRGVRSATAFGSLNAGSMTFIKKLTSDGSDDDLSFVDGASDVVLDDTYKEYVFLINDIHAETDTQYFTFQGSIDTGSNYNVATTSTMFTAAHNEADTETSLAYETGVDLAQGTGFINLSPQVGNGNDECCSGYLRLFDPSNTTFVKHYLIKTQFMANDGANAFTENAYTAGYCNVTAAIDAVQFVYSSGNINAGTIKLYGIKDS